MSENSGTFLTKSIILLAVFLVCIGTSMWLGKELGRRIMDTTRTNIENRFPDTDLADTDDNSDYMLNPGAERSSFGYDSGSYGPARVPDDWADPPVDDLAPGETGPSVIVTPIGPDDPQFPEADGPLASGEPLPGDNTVEDRETRNLFNLGDGTTYRIQVGIYDDKENAEGVWRDLTRAGYNASISSFYDENEIQKYRVTVGFYHTLDEASSVADDIRSLGFNGWVQEMETE